MKQSEIDKLKEGDIFVSVPYGQGTIAKDFADKEFIFLGASAMATYSQYV